MSSTTTLRVTFRKVVWADTVADRAGVTLGNNEVLLTPPGQLTSAVEAFADLVSAVRDAAQELVTRAESAGLVLESSEVRLRRTEDDGSLRVGFVVIISCTGDTL